MVRPDDHRDAFRRPDIKEIKKLADAYSADPDAPIGPRIAAALQRADQRIATQVEELSAMRQRLADYRRRHAAALSGSGGDDFGVPDPPNFSCAA